MTTIPDTNGVIIFLVYLNKRLTIISMGAAAIQTPKIAGKAATPNPKGAKIEVIAPIKEKLVPCTQSNPQPMGPIR